MSLILLLYWLDEDRLEFGEGGSKVEAALGRVKCAHVVVQHFSSLCFCSVTLWPTHAVLELFWYRGSACMRQYRALLCHRTSSCET